MRIYWKIEKLIDTKKLPDGQENLLSITFGHWGRPPYEEKSRHIGLIELQEMGRAKELDHSEDGMLWSMVGIYIDLALEKNNRGEYYSLLGPDARKEMINIGEVLRRAELDGWDVNMVITYLDQHKEQVRNAAQEVIDSEFSGAKGKRPQATHPTQYFPPRMIRNVVQASAKTKLQNRVKQHFAKTGKKFPKGKKK